jgi:hypothetical protein
MEAETKAAGKHREGKTGVGRIKWVMIGLLVILFLSAALVVSRREKHGPILDAKIEEIRKSGYPVTADELENLHPPLPDSENSALIYLKAFSNFAPLPANVTNWPILNKSAGSYRAIPIPSEVKKGIADYLEQNKTALELLHRGALMEKGYYSTGLTNGFPLQVEPPILQIRFAAQLLALKAVWDAEEGRADAAANSTVDLLGIERSLEQSPFLISQIIRVVNLPLGSATLEQVLNKTRLSEEQLRRLSMGFQKAEAYDGLKLAAISQRCLGIWSLDCFRRMTLRSEFTSILNKVRELWFKASNYRNDDYLFYLDTMQQYIAAAELSFPKRLQTTKEVTQKARQYSGKSRYVGMELLTDWDSIIGKDAECHAALRAAQAALGVERYRLANHNQLPNSLQDLVPSFLDAEPIDPFDGKPLRFKKLAKGYVIYSVGPDGIDDGGKERKVWEEPENTGQKSENYDLTFIMER